MPDSYRDIKNNLEKVSALINDFLCNKENHEEELILTEKWLTTLLDKIRVGKLENIPLTGSRDSDKNIRKDGILIINSSTEILRSPGSHNYFLNPLNYSDQLKLIDFIDNPDKNGFESALSESILHKKNTQFEAFLKTATGGLNKCLLEIDILSSSIENDRIIVYYSFNDVFNIQTFDFQSIVFDKLPGMDVFLFDREYRYILSGGKEKERYNLFNSNFVGKKMFEVFDKQSQRRFFPFYSKALNGKYTEGEVRYKDDVYYMVAVPVKNHENKTVAGILISQNVTKDKLLEESLVKSKEQAQKADKTKSIFLANMSHEIRTPLNSIIGFTEQLKKTDLTEQQQKFVTLINNSSEHLLYLVNEIVFLFKLGMDKVYIEKIAFPIRELLKEINDAHKKQADEKKLDFIIEIDDKLPEILKGDPFRLRQILMNLLVNALKYTDKGHIKLRCKLISETRKSTELLFEISDTGIGISKKDLPFIFDVFEQGNKRMEKIRGGAGLGLGICKKLVDLFKGEITVESKLNKGSTFSVQIPFEKSSVDKLRKKEKEYHLKDDLLAGKKILLADDDEHNLLLAGMLLKGWNSDFTLVKNGEEAIETMEKEKFDLILLDIHMPKKNGVQVIKTLRSDREGLNHFTPVLALTANALKADINRYLKAGFNDYVVKPFKEAYLYSKLCNILQVEPVKLRESKIKTSNIGKNLTNNSIDLHELRKTANGDDLFFNMMIDNFTSNAEKLLEIFKTGIKNKDWDEIGEKAHKAIPSFKFFKLNGISSQLEKMENLALRDKHFSELPDIINKLEVEINNIIQQAKAAKL